MRVGFLTPWPVDAPSAWSGVVKPAFDHLSDRVETVPLVSADVRDGLVDRAYLRVCGRRFGEYLPAHALHTAWRHGQAMSRRVREAGVHAIVALAASTDLAYLGGEVPIVQISDTTFTGLRNLYPAYQHLSPLMSPQVGVLTRRANARASWTVATTHWALDSLADDDGVPRGRLSVAPFGPSVASPLVAPRRTAGHVLRALLVASDWTRKGGADVVAAVASARASGWEVSLTVLGDVPAHLPDWVEGRGRVSRTELADLYATHDVLVELARNTSGITLTDAAGFGLPVIAAAYGGVADIVADGISGILVSPGQQMSVAAGEALVLLAHDRSLADRLSRGGRLRAETLLNWDAWADHVVDRIRWAVDTRHA